MMVGEGRSYTTHMAHVRTAAALLEMVPEDRHLELADLVPSVAVVLWWRQRGHRVSFECLQARFGVSRATAFRWQRALKDHDSQTAQAATLRLPGRTAGCPAPMGADDARCRMGVAR